MWASSCRFPRCWARWPGQSLPAAAAGPCVERNPCAKPNGCEMCWKVFGRRSACRAARQRRPSRCWCCGGFRPACTRWYPAWRSSGWWSPSCVWGWRRLCWGCCRPPRRCIGWRRIARLFLQICSTAGYCGCPAGPGHSFPLIRRMRPSSACCCWGWGGWPRSGASACG